jgi:hypothetical protein
LAEKTEIERTGELNSKEFKDKQTITPEQKDER